MLKKGKPIQFGKISLPKLVNDETEPEKEHPSSTVPSDAIGFGSFGKAEVETSESKNTETPSSSFSLDKKAKQFDIDELVTQARESIAEMKTAEKETTEDNNDEEGENIGTPFPPGFKEEEAELSDVEIGPPLPPGFSAASGISRVEDEASSEEEEDKETIGDRLPLSQEIPLQHGTKAVSAIGVDPAGSRLVSGSIDYDISYWDFMGMDSSLKAFRTLRPCECHPINDVKYSSTGDSVLIVAGSAQAKIYDRDGIEVVECKKGDPYLTDMRKTTGHVSGLSAGAWHPRNKSEFLTCSLDGTCRIWEIESADRTQKHVIKARSQSGLRIAPNICNYSRDGNLVACGCQDGSIHMWDHRKNYVNTAITMRNAHQNGSEITSLDFSYDGREFITRSNDETLKLWDLRKYKTPVHVASGLFSRFAMTDCIFSPDDKMVLTGTSLEKGEQIGKVHVFDRVTFEKLCEVQVSDSHVIRLVWHPKLNQIFIGCGNGVVKCYYDPKKSHRGAILCADKKQRKKKQTEVFTTTQVITPHALPMFRQDRYKPARKKQEKERLDPVKSHRPDIPLTQKGTGGRAAMTGSTLSSFVAKNYAMAKRVDDVKDPREALLRHAKEAEENPYWVTPAYKQTQPKPVFQSPEEEEEEEGPDAKKQRT